MTRVEFLGATLVRLGLRLLRAAPPAGRRAFAHAVAMVAWSLRIRRAVALENVRLSFPEWEAPRHQAVARQSYHSMALALVDAVTSDLLPDEAVAAQVRCEDWRGLDQVLARREPVLVASAHLGSWELFGEVMARRGVPLSAVVRPLSGAFNTAVVNSRVHAGLELLAPRGAVQHMLRALERGRAVVQFIDQALPSPSAVWVPFFGRRASTTPALSVAALRSGAPVYVVGAIREGPGLVMHVEGPFPVPALDDEAAAVASHVATLTAAIERLVRRAPDQWLWLHRRWKGTPPSERQAKQHAGLQQGGEAERGQ